MLKSMRYPLYIYICLLICLGLFSGCGDSDDQPDTANTNEQQDNQSDDSDNADQVSHTFTISGHVAGLPAGHILDFLVEGQRFTMANGAFETTAIAYDVSQNQPRDVYVSVNQGTLPYKYRCKIINGAGVIEGSDIEGVIMRCQDQRQIDCQSPDISFYQDLAFKPSQSFSLSFPKDYQLREVFNRNPAYAWANHMNGKYPPIPSFLAEWGSGLGPQPTFENMAALEAHFDTLEKIKDLDDLHIFLAYQSSVQYNTRYQAMLFSIAPDGVVQKLMDIETSRSTLSEVHQILCSLAISSN